MSSDNTTRTEEMRTTGDAATTPRGHQDGLAWDEQLFDSVPIWTREPSEEAILRTCRKHYGLMNACDKGDENVCTLSFFAAGAFNKLYLVTANDSRALMRISLPVYPSYKTRGEVTTLRWIKDNTDLPVPEVLAFDDTNNNEIGFEWILMELLPGRTAYQGWRKLSMAQKTTIVEQLAEYQGQLSGAATKHGFHEIGTLSDIETEATPSRLVAHEFFVGKRLEFDMPRGPFPTSQDWLGTLLQFTIQEQTAIIQATTDVAKSESGGDGDEEESDGSDDDSDGEEAKEIIETGYKLLHVLPKVFENTGVEKTCLYHDDLNLKNILIDDNGKITGLVDWECVSALPLWMMTRMPEFIRLDDEQRWE